MADVVLLGLIGIVAFVLLAVCWLNTVSHTSDLDQLYRQIATVNPDCIAFTLRRLPDNGGYLTAMFSDTGTLNTTVTQSPVLPSGQYRMAHEHGTVTALADQSGFRVSGLGADAAGMPLTCPAGFSGVTCAPDPICEGARPGTYRTLSYSQFRGLNLYQSNRSITALEEKARRKRDAATDHRPPYHSRIRVHCLGNNRFELQTCPPNKLLDGATARCVPYDLCQDQLDGFRHNTVISEGGRALASTEYYQCVGNKSVRSECAAGSTYSSVVRGCITLSPCSGRGSITLDNPKDPSGSYIQCANDAGTLVSCEHGLDVLNGVHVCRDKPEPRCVPGVLSIDRSPLSYNYGVIQCPDGEIGAPLQTICETKQVDRVHSWSWGGETFSYTLSMPDRVWDDTRKACVAPTQSIITGLVGLRWSAAMAFEHPFDLRTQQYVCDNPRDIRWDYRAGITVPETSKPFTTVSTAAPCQPGPFTAYDPLQLYGNNMQPPMVFWLVAHIPRYGWSFWPRANPTTPRTYQWITVVENRKTGVVATVKCKSDKPPIGFYDTDAPGPLRLRGAAPTTFDAVIANSPAWQCLVIATGVLSVPMFTPAGPIGEDVNLEEYVPPGSTRELVEPPGVVRVMKRGDRITVSKLPLDVRAYSYVLGTEYLKSVLPLKQPFNVYSKLRIDPGTRTVTYGNAVHRFGFMVLRLELTLRPNTWTVQLGEEEKHDVTNETLNF